MAESNFVGALTEDIEILSTDDDAPAPAESDVSEPSSFSTAETADTQNKETTQKPTEGSKPYDADKSLLNNSRPTPQNYEPPSEQEKTALDSELTEFYGKAITEAVPQLRWMDAGEKEQLIGKANSEIFQEIYADKRFMASLEKSYDGSRQSLQRGAMLLAERWLRALPHAIGTLNLPKPLTQHEANNMQPMEILSSKRFGQKSKPWKPEYIFDLIGRSKPRAAGARR